MTSVSAPSPDSMEDRLIGSCNDALAADGIRIHADKSVKDQVRFVGERIKPVHDGVVRCAVFEVCGVVCSFHSRSG
jgi:hypothetical protein